MNRSEKWYMPERPLFLIRVPRDPCCSFFLFLFYFRRCSFLPISREGPWQPSSRLNASSAASVQIIKIGLFRQSEKEKSSPELEETAVCQVEKHPTRQGRGQDRNEKKERKEGKRDAMQPKTDIAVTLQLHTKMQYAHSGRHRKGERRKKIKGTW